MGAIWVEGFRAVGAANFANEYTVAGSGTLAYAVFTDRRAACGGATITDVSLQRAVTPTGARVIVGFAYKHTHGTAHDVLQVKEGSTVHASIVIGATGLVSAYRGDKATGSLLGDAAGGTEIATGSTVYIEADITVHDSSGAITVNVDDVQLLHLTSKDTRNSGTGVINAVRVYGTDKGATIGDLYILDPGDSIAPTSMIGKAARVDVYLPAANGTPSEFTAVGGTKPTVVADATGNDGSTTYATATTTGLRDVYRMESMTHSPAAIHAVRVMLAAKKSSGSITAVIPRTQWSSFGTVTTDPIPLTTSWTLVDGLLNAVEVDAGGITQSEFNAAAFGYESQGA